VDFAKKELGKQKHNFKKYVKQYQENFETSVGDVRNEIGEVKENIKQLLIEENTIFRDELRKFIVGISDQAKQLQTRKQKILKEKCIITEKQAHVENTMRQLLADKRKFQQVQIEFQNYKDTWEKKIEENSKNQRNFQAKFEHLRKEAERLVEKERTVGELEILMKKKLADIHKRENKVNRANVEVYHKHVQIQQKSSALKLQKKSLEEERIVSLHEIETRRRVVEQKEQQLVKKVEKIKNKEQQLLGLRRELQLRKKELEAGRSNLNRLKNEIIRKRREQKERSVISIRNDDDDASVKTLVYE